MDVIEEAERIKNQLRTCRTAVEINLVADEERPKVKALAEHSDEGRTQARIIANLKEYRLRQINSEVE